MHSNQTTGKYKRKGVYAKYGKRALDIAIAGFILLLFWWIYIIVAILVKINLGSPIIFVQKRPGKFEKESGCETIFKMYKFRTMNDKKDSNGNYLPDEFRLTRFGRILRATSLDELPELFNILNGSMSFVGPRPQLIQDVVFMTTEQRMRHSVKPGLTGLAQVNGRNAISWSDKLKWDLKYIDNISFRCDMCIVFKTVLTALIKHEGITEDGMATAVDYGDYLLNTGELTEYEYQKKMSIAREILANGCVRMCDKRSN